VWKVFKRTCWTNQQMFVIEKKVQIFLKVIYPLTTYLMYF
jgi:hypothetical protein